MTTLYLATGNALAELTILDDRCEVALHLVDRAVQCVAIDPLQLQYLYCGTFGQGLWYSRNGGRDWHRASVSLSQSQITSVAVSFSERVAECGVVYAGSEPSAVFRSEDAGESWQAQAGLNQLPSASGWSFPPRPDTHHVRWIEPDRFAPGRLYVAIEAGALIRSNNGGLDWYDRTATAPIDTHQMAMHRSALGRIYSAAGDGYFESLDGGEAWHRIEDGLEHRYVWSVAVDSADADNRIISAAAGPRQSHDRSQAESRLHRRTATSAWQPISNGLPGSKGKRTAVVAADPERSGMFYAAIEDEVYHSTDGGAAWQRFQVDWPAGFRVSEPHRIVVAP